MNTKSVARALTILAAATAAAGAFALPASAVGSDATPTTAIQLGATQPHTERASTVQPRSNVQIIVLPYSKGEVPTWFWGRTHISVKNIGDSSTEVVLRNPVTEEQWLSGPIAPGETWEDSGRYWGIPLDVINQGPSSVLVRTR